MSKPSAYIVSLKYAPGLKKEFVLLGEKLRRRGADVNYVVARPYQHLSDINADRMIYLTDSTNLRALVLETAKYLSSRSGFADIFRSSPPDFVCCYNFHPLNIFILRYLKRTFPKCVTALYIHEPHKPDKRPYGLTKGMYIRVFELLQSISLNYADHVILPSELACELFVSRYRGYSGSVHYAPILVPDKRNSGISKERKFFTYAGGVHRATGFDTFIDLVNHSASLKAGFEFLAITSSNIDGYLRGLSPEGRGVLTLINKRTITDQEIDEAISASFSVLRLDREITQSGVVPVCFMNATPVIVRDLPGFTQHVKHAHDGYVVTDPCSPAEIMKGMMFVKQHFDELSRHARKSYEEIWAEHNWARYYQWLIDILSL
jgi:glycosyltransferase involved in cell wall biosynthesis